MNNERIEEMIKFNTDIVSRIFKKTGFKVEFTTLDESVEIDFWVYDEKEKHGCGHLSLSTYFCKNENERRHKAIIKNIEERARLPKETEIIFIQDGLKGGNAIDQLFSHAATRDRK